MAAIAFSAPRAQAPPSRDPARLRPGIFLYASPGIGDTRFIETVVLLLEHGPGGSAGVVVNQPSETQLRKVLPEMPAARRLEVPVYWGGPVEPGGMVVLLRNPRRTGGTSVVLPEVYRTTDLEALRAALEDVRPDRQVRVYSGYAGWSPGQLDREVRRGAWVLDRADADAVFALDPAPLWDKVHAILKRLEARSTGGRSTGRRGGEEVGG
jgi:putative transcriptional regulator